MGLITKPKVPAYAEQEPSSLVQDPVVHMEHVYQESADEVEREQAFRCTLDTRRSDESDDRLEKRKSVVERRMLKAKYWMDRISAEGEAADWDEVVRKMRVHDPRMAGFVEKLVRLRRSITSA